MGPPHGDLVNLFTEAPTGLLSWAFVYCLQLLGWGGGVPQSLAEPEQASLLWTLPLMPTPQLSKKERETVSVDPEDWVPAPVLAVTTQQPLSPVPGQRTGPSTAGFSCLGDVLGAWHGTQYGWGSMPV